MVDPVGGGERTDAGHAPRRRSGIDTSTEAVQATQPAIAAATAAPGTTCGLWNNVMMRPFDQHAKMSQFGSLWRGFTCGQLNELLEEYPAATFRT